MQSNITFDEILELVKNRPVVPFLGAGISVASGFPSVRQINQYLAKVDFSIQHEVFRHRYASIGERPDSYRLHPDQFLKDFGWPDMGRLDVELWHWLSQSKNLEKLVADCKKINPDHSEPIQDSLAYDLSFVSSKSPAA